MKAIRYLLFSLILGSVIFVSGCSKKQETTVSNATGETAGSSQTTSVVNDQKGYFYVSKGSAMFIQWTEVDKQLTGQLQIIFEDNSNPPKVQSSTHSFKGVHNGSDVSLSFSGSIWNDSLANATWTGTLKGDQLSLVVANNSGGLNTFVFKTGTVADYNKTAADLQHLVETKTRYVQQQAAQEQAQQQANDNRDKQLSALNRGVSSLTSYTKKLATDTKFDDVLARYSDHWNKMQADYQKLNNDASKRPLTDVQIATCQTDVATMQTDVASMQTDRAALDVRKTSINDDISYIKDATSATQKSWQAVSSQGISSPYSESDISSMIDGGQKQIDSSTQALESAQNQASSFESQGNQLLQSASKLVSSLRPTN